MTEEYTDGELIEMVRRCKEENGYATPRLFNGMEDTCSASTVMRRFGSWEAARDEAGIEEDNSHRTGRRQQYTDGDVLRDIRECASRHDGKATVSLMNEEKDLVAPSVAVKRFGSWTDAKEEAGVKADARDDNHRPRMYSDEDYYELLQECKDKHGKVTQRKFDEDDDFPSSGAVAQRFKSWKQAKKLAGIETETQTYDDDELLEQIIVCYGDHRNGELGDCTADEFAHNSDTASPETLQRRFGSWSEAKEKADDTLLEQLISCCGRYEDCSPDMFDQKNEFVSSDILIARFGSWSEAKEKAREYQDRNRSDSNDQKVGC